MIYAFSEIVASGGKPLALSPPLTEEEYERLREPIEEIASEYGVKTYVDKDFLTTKLFNPAFTEGKLVVHIMIDPKVINEYRSLKELKRRHISEHNLAVVEDELARRLGALLGYDRDTVEGLLKNPRF